MSTIAFLGTGIMGKHMAANLLKQKHNVTVYNRTANKAADLVEMGAKLAETPSAAVHEAEIIITMLGNDQAVRAVALGENGFLKNAGPGCVWVDCSTTNPVFARQMAEAAGNCDTTFLDAPVAGSKTQAMNAELVFVVGGNSSSLEKCQALFDAMGKKTLHAGEIGQGNALKLVLNSLLASSMTVFAESLALGRALGIDEQLLLNVVVGGPVVPPYLAAKRKKIEERDFEAEFPLEWMHKDLHMVALAAYEAGVAMPLSDASKALYQKALQRGLGRQDFTAVYQSIIDSN